MRFGPLKHLVYNSGVTGTNSRFEAVSTQTLRDNLDINLMGAFLCARAAIPRLSTKHGKTRRQHGVSVVGAVASSAPPANMSGMPRPRAGSTAL